MSDRIRLPMMAFLAMTLSVCADKSAGSAFSIDDEAWTIRLSACQGQDLAHRPASLQPYLLSMLGLADAGDVSEATTCAVEATSCRAFLACFGVDAQAPCDDRDGSSACTDDHTARYCDTIEARLRSVAFERTYDCAHAGSLRPVCVPGLWGGNEPPCSAGTCAELGERCESDVQYQCIDIGIPGQGIAARTDCAWLGSHCVATIEEGAAKTFCGADADPCDWSTCLDEFTARACLFGQSIMKFDCRAGDPSFRCLASTSSAAQCAVEEGQRECEPGEVLCEGSVGRVCTGGKWFAYDCARFDDATCEIGVHSIALEPSVYCVSPRWEAYLDTISTPWN